MVRIRPRERAGRRVSPWFRRAPSRLESVPLFRALAPDQHEAVANLLDDVNVPRGETIISQGDFAYEFFAIETGTARVEQGGAVVATLGPGDFFGELDLLVSGSRTGSIVAVSRCGYSPCSIGAFAVWSVRIPRSRARFASRWPAVSPGLRRPEPRPRQALGVAKASAGPLRLHAHGMKP